MRRSSIERIPFKDEKDLLSKIYPHGIILAERDRRAVYLPVVWEQLPERDVFLNSLKEKAKALISNKKTHGSINLTCKSKYIVNVVS